MVALKGPSTAAGYMAAALSLLLAHEPSNVEAHGHLTSPRSRNYFASVDGVDGSVAGLPTKEYCAHCLNLNTGVCGQVSGGGRIYDNYLDSTGQPMPWISQGTYVEGSIIQIESYLDTHHNGHMTVSACADGPASTQECFDRPENKLTFVEDLTDSSSANGPAGGMPADPAYPERGMYAGGQNGGIKSFQMRFQLPQGVFGDQVMLQWRYITANSCSPPGYDAYFANNPEIPVSYWTPGVTECQYPLPNNGDRSSVWPEQFFNCAEISVTTSSPTPVPPPTSAPPPTVASPVMSPTPQSNPACCTQNFKTCVTWCGTTEQECETCSNTDVFWASVEGSGSSCIPRNDACTNNNDGCCNGLVCEGNQYYAQCVVAPVPAPTNPSPTAPPPTYGAPTPMHPTNPAPAPTQPAPTSPSPPTPTPGPLDSYSCSANSNGKTTFEALKALESITYTVSTSPYILSAVASGGAAGSGSSVVSESQAYAVLAAGMALVSVKEGEADYDEVASKFEGYFNGWRKMCENSTPVSTCQGIKYCDGGSVPCLPGWKHSALFDNVEGTGSAPDGDEDAIVGMIIALNAVKNNAVRPSWYDEVYDWADRSCTQFLVDNTVLSNTNNHRLLKLGSCWGGWNTDGNNPSYHAPGHYRMMRDFQASVQSRTYSLPPQVNAAEWNKLIDTSYKALSTTQCANTGLVPNWALVKEVNSQTLAKQDGAFSGSGTPQYEFGSEASRTMWRIAFDAAAYPEESAAQSAPFLAPLHSKMVQNFQQSPLNGWEYFKEGTLEACGTPYVSNVFGSWQWNYFISAPVFSALVAGIDTYEFSGKTYDQQDMVDVACELVSDTDNQSYYPLSWQVLAQMTLNGEVARAGSLLAGTPAPTVSPAPTFNPTSGPTQKPTTASPTEAPITTTTTTTTSGDNSCYSFNYKDCTHPDLLNSASCTLAVFLPNGSNSNCVALWGECTGGYDSDCCGESVCVGNWEYAQCMPPQTNPAPVVAPSPPPVMAPTEAPVAANTTTTTIAATTTTTATTTTMCVECDDVVTDWTANGLDCSDSAMISAKCTADNNWVLNKFCRLSCYDSGDGYDGDVCCNTSLLPTGAPSTSPTTTSTTPVPSVLPTGAPTESPTTTSTTPTPCIVCDDIETTWMQNNGKDCVTSSLIDTKCNKSDAWATSKFCQLSCYNAGNGYDGDVCCNGNIQSRFLRGQN